MSISAWVKTVMDSRPKHTHIIYSDPSKSLLMYYDSRKMS